MSDTFQVGPPGVCALCQNAHNPMDTAVVGVLKGWAHQGCLNSVGLTPEQFEASIPCCNAAVSLRNLGGSIVQPDPAVPPDEIWRAIPKTRQLTRYHIEPNGTVKLIGASLGPPPPVALPEEGDVVK